MLKNLLQKADYITAASPLILQYSRDVTKSLNVPAEVILNHFPRYEFRNPEVKHSDKLQVIWFSQNISYNRGLEKILPVVRKNNNIELHLFGNCNDDFKKEFLSTQADNIFVHASLPQAELHKRLSSFDIGLAIEPGKDLNNELAVSNKMLAAYIPLIFLQKKIRLRLVSI